MRFKKVERGVPGGTSDHPESQVSAFICLSCYCLRCRCLRCLCLTCRCLLSFSCRCQVEPVIRARCSSASAPQRAKTRCRRRKSEEMSVYTSRFCSHSRSSSPIPVWPLVVKRIETTCYSSIINRCLLQIRPVNPWEGNRGN